MEKPQKRENPDSDKPFPLNERRYVPNFEIKEDDENNVRVISYNILCDSLFTVSTQIPEEEMKRFPYYQWNERRSKIIKEITSTIKGDIICFQELERDEEWLKEFAEAGYDTAFKPRTGDHSEGVAVMWNNKK
jgi:mRNA deadenylase 3'-5' endonuclease subunit Ccr4